jgi:hypothetical protein
MTDQNPTPSQTASPSSTLRSLENARSLAKSILQRYPDYGKSPPEYIAAVVEIIASYSPWVQSRLADLRTGIPARCEFLPTVAAIVKLAEPLAAQEAEAEERRRRYGHVLPASQRLTRRADFDAPQNPAVAARIGAGLRDLARKLRMTRHDPIPPRAAVFEKPAQEYSAAAMAESRARLGIAEPENSA